MGDHDVLAPGTLWTVSQGVCCINPHIYSVYSIGEGAGQKPVRMGGVVMVIIDA
jgi:hypothetical protein